MGIFDSLFSSSSSKGDIPSYLRDTYKKFGLDPDDEGGGSMPNDGKNMYCTMCRRIYNGGVMCPDCHNPLVEWH